MAGNTTTNSSIRWSDIQDPQQLCNTAREVASGGSTPNENQRQQLSQLAFVAENILQLRPVQDYISQQGVRVAGAGSNGGTTTTGEGMTGQQQNQGGSYGGSSKGSS